MKNMNSIRIACSSVMLATALGMPAYADKFHTTAANTETSSAQAERRASDAWREGKLDTIYLFNPHLNNFTIDPEVVGNTVILTGKVESSVDKELAEQIAKGIDGITVVTNRLVVVSAGDAKDPHSDNDRSFREKIADATVTAQVKSKLLANSETSGLAINVDTVAHTVSLSGDVKSSAEKDLAEQITKQVDGVVEVNNNLQVKG